MNREHNRKLEALFDAAMDFASTERSEFLDRECAGDQAMRRELDELLAAAPPMATRDQPTAAPKAARHQATVAMRAQRDDTDTVVTPPRHEVIVRASRSPGFPPGTSIDQYELIRHLGGGGMGDVYLARDTRLARRVAIKFMQHADRSVSERFLLEAQATARCSHENIVVIHDVKEHQGVPFMVLEYLKGKTIGDLMGEDRLPPGRAVQLMVPVVRALVCAHQHKIVHRDLKPANIVMTDTGTIKVLDFGVAKIVSAAKAATPVATTGGPTGTSLQLAIDLTHDGTLVGTVPYMSPEQWGADSVDHRSDIWAVGIMLYQMVVGRHPLAPLGGRQLAVTAVLDQAMPSAHNAGVDMPPELADIIDSCLRKRKAQRMPSAQKLLAALEPLLPGQRPVELSAGENPYTGLTAFQETDANRFFGRTREINTVVARLHGSPLLGVVGPSGTGKSSFVRAGVIPALKQSGEQWETLVIRPGRHPMAALANIVVPMLASAGTTVSTQVAEHQNALLRLYQEPGYLGTVLRNRARTQGRKILLFVDQFEELFTLIREADERLAFTACLAGMADDALSPLRLMLSIRSDFLDRVAEDQRFMSELSQNLVFLAAPDRMGLRDAIVRPAEMMRYRFETPTMIEHMLDTLQATPGCLPLLQFAASKLWEARDRDRRLLTELSYRRFGGVAGALATHADAVLTGLPPRAQGLARVLFLQLVTPERTRAIASMSELCELTEAPEEAERVIQQLVDARLLVVQRSRNSGATVEIVHESLIHSWPTLAHWLDESQEDAAFREQLRTAAKQWEARGHSQDLLWRGETLEEARTWRRRYRGVLPLLQEQFLAASFGLATRAARIKRAMMAGTMGFLSLLVVVGSVALVTIREAEQLAQDKAAEAIAALERAKSSDLRAEKSEADLERKNQQLTAALARAEQARDEAMVAQTQAEQAQHDAEAAREIEERTKWKLEEALAQTAAAKKVTDELLAKERKRRELAEKKLDEAIRGQRLREPRNNN